MREDHGQMRLVFDQGQGLRGVVSDLNTQKCVARLEPRGAGRVRCGASSWGVGRRRGGGGGGVGGGK